MGSQFNIPMELIPTFLLLAEELNISRCARKLGLSQPALTRQLQNLEDAFGSQLFIRQSRGLALTHMGRMLKKEILPVFENLQSSLARIRNAQTELSGTIQFGCFSEIGTNLLAPVLFEFCKQHPGVSADIRYLSEAEIISGVAGGQLHLGIASQAPSNEMVRSYKLLDEHIHLVTSASNPDLQRNPNPKFAGYKLQDRLLLSFFKQYPKLFPQGSPELAIAVNSHQAMIEAVIHLGLYAALPHHSLSAHYNSGKIRQASNCEMTNKVFLIMPDSEFPERRSLEVVKFLKLKFKSAQGERG